MHDPIIRRKKDCLRLNIERDIRFLAEERRQLAESLGFTAPFFWGSHPGNLSQESPAPSPT